MAAAAALTALLLLLVAEVAAVPVAAARPDGASNTITNQSRQHVQNIASACNRIALPAQDSRSQRCCVLAAFRIAAWACLGMP